MSLCKNVAVGKKRQEGEVIPCNHCPGDSGRWAARSSRKSRRRKRPVEKTVSRSVNALLVGSGERPYHMRMLCMDNEAGVRVDDAQGQGICAKQRESRPHSSRAYHSLMGFAIPTHPSSPFPAPAPRPSILLCFFCPLSNHSEPASTLGTVVVECTSPPILLAQAVRQCIWRWPSGTSLPTPTGCLCVCCVR